MTSAAAKAGVDPRVSLFLLLTGAVGGMLARSEATLFGLFFIALVYLALGGIAGKIPGYLILWLILWGIARLGVAILRADPTLGASASPFQTLGFRVTGRWCRCCLPCCSTGYPPVALWRR